MKNEIKMLHALVNNSHSLPNLETKKINKIATFLKS